MANEVAGPGSPRPFLLTHVLAWAVCLAAWLLPQGPGTALVVVPYVMFFPGDALRTALRVSVPDVHLRGLYGVAGSLALLMAVGAGTTVVFRLFGLDAGLALDRGPLFVALSLVVAACLAAVAAVKRYRPSAVPDAWHWLTWGIIAGLLTLACVGAEVVDETGSPALTVVALAVPAVLVVWCATADTALTRRLRPSALFALALGVAWSFSQRTDYLYGYDVHQEYGWALHTQEAGHWVHTLGDAYGAMLSITVLPVAVAALSGLDLVEWFKTLAPVAFALYIMGIFLFVRRFASDRWSFVATLLLALIPQSLWQLPGVSRQEVGLLVFAAIMLLLFDAARAGRVGRGARLLAAALAVTLAVTHYTTAYVTLGLLVGAAVCSFVVRRFSRPLREDTRHLSPMVLVALLVATVGWNAVYTQSSGNVGAATDKAATQTGLAEREGGLLASFLDGINVTEGTPAQYFAETREQSQERIWKLIYSSNVQKEFVAEATPRPIPEQYGPLRGLAPASEAGYVLLRQVTNLSAVGGAAYLAWRALRRMRPRRGQADAEPSRTGPGPSAVPIDLVCLVGLALVATLLTRFNASLAQAYNPERLLLQTGMLLGVGVALMADAVVRRSSRSRRVILARVVPGVVAAGLALAMVFDATGLRALLIIRDAGNLMRDGEHAHRYRVTDADHAAARWLSGRYRFDDMVFTDSYGVLLTNEDPAFQRGMIAELSPYTLDQRGYVLATTENVERGMARVSSEGIRTSFTYPRNFMSKYKSRIYSNGTAEVYR